MHSALVNYFHFCPFLNVSSDVSKNVLNYFFEKARSKKDEGQENELGFQLKTPKKLSGDKVQVKHEMRQPKARLRTADEQSGSLKRIDEGIPRQNTEIQCPQEKCTDVTTMKKIPPKVRKRYSTLERENQQLRQALINKNDEMEQLRTEKSETENENQRIQSEKDAIAAQHWQIGQYLSSMQNENYHLREENKQKILVISQYQQDSDNKANTIQQLRQQNNDMRNEIQQLRDTASSMSSKISDYGSVVVSENLLGRGAWGNVYKGDFYGAKVAVKEYHELIISPHNLRMLEREINIASQCRHPNLLQFLCATRISRNGKDRLLIVTELMDLALRTFVERHAENGKLLWPQEVASISLDIALGLNYLHSKKPNPIIHRDLSSANVLLWIQNGTVRRAKISDYGSANFLREANTPNPGAGIYAAPEASQSKQDPKV